MSVEINTTNSNAYYTKTRWTAFIMSLLVMYIHSNNLQNVGLLYKEESADWILTHIISYGFGRIAVPFFFMISGVHFFTFNNKNQDILNQIKEKMLRRVKTLLIPYITWNFICYIFYFVITHTSFFELMNADIVVTLSTNNILNGVFLHKYNFPFWYLRDLIVFTFFSPIIYYLLTHKWFSIVIMSALALFAVILKPELSSLFFFILGGYMQTYHTQLIKNRCENRVVRYICLIAILALIICNYKDIELIANILLLASPMSVWFAIDSIKFPQENWFISQSFFIYASHILPVTIIMKILSKISVQICRGASALAYLITPWICLILILGVAKLLNKHFPKVYKVLSGGR